MRICKSLRKATRSCPQREQAVSGVRPSEGFARLIDYCKEFEKQRQLSFLHVYFSGRHLVSVRVGQWSTGHAKKVPNYEISMKIGQWKVYTVLPSIFLI